MRVVMASCMKFIFCTVFWQQVERLHHSRSHPYISLSARRSVKTMQLREYLGLEGCTCLAWIIHQTRSIELRANLTQTDCFSWKLPVCRSRKALDDFRRTSWIMQARRAIVKVGVMGWWGDGVMGRRKIYPLNCLFTFLLPPLLPLFHLLEIDLKSLIILLIFILYRRLLIQSCTYL